MSSADVIQNLVHCQVQARSAIRQLVEQYAHPWNTDQEMSQTKQQDCIFCNKPESKMVFKNEFAYAVRDGHPVTELHTLIIPRRCVPTYFDLTENEIRDCQKLLKLARQDILNIDKSVTGFNIGINVGKDAGQSIFHCHIHLIPRRKGDVEEPRGGVRGVIPHKQKY